VTKLVFATQQVDPDHPVLAATVAKIAALAQRVDEVVVLALSAKTGVLPDNCRVRTFGAPTQVLRGLRFAQALSAELVRGRPKALVAHMSPIYAVLAAPVVRPLGVRVLLWYTQVRTNPLLERAVRLADAVFTTDERSFPFTSPKVHAIGHGIDVSRFGCNAAPGRQRVRLLALGRYSQVKCYPELIAAVAKLDAELVIHGSTETDAERAHLPEVARLAAAVGDRIVVGGPVPPSEVPALLADADALVSGTRGGADKVVLEAGAACVPAFSPAPAFADLLPAPLHWEHDLAASLGQFIALTPAERHALGRELSARVREQHSLDRWADQIVEAATR
jgi:glycosyltransferase involved in cell wall biosynthesis